VSKNKQLASRIAAVVAVAALAGTSAFAESRPANGTRARAEGRDSSWRGRAAAGSVSRRGDASTSRSTASGSTIDRNAVRGGDSRFDRGNDTVVPRTEDRSTRDNRSNDTYQNRSTSRGGNGSYRNGGNGSYHDGRNGSYHDGRNGSYRNGGNGSYRNGGNGSYRDGRGGNNRSYGNRTPYYAQGRVSRVNRYGSGYRIWIVGSPYPFFVPEAYYRSNRFRIGLSIRLGGYYNPLGYYDYYDGYYDDYSRGSSRGELRGVVESVDYRRDTFVIRNEATGSFVTVVLRDRREDVRTGDFVEVSGDWTRNGLFEAYDVDQLDYDRDYRR